MIKQLHKHIASWVGLFLLAALLISCAKESSVVDTPEVKQAEPVPVGLSGYVPKAQTAGTRSSILYNTDQGIPDGRSIGVYAYYHQNSTWADDDDAEPKCTQPDFMFNQQATHNKLADAYIYSPLKYWPNTPEDKLSFIGYYPYTDKTIDDDDENPVVAESKESTGIVPQLTISGTGLPTFDFTVKDNVDEQVDFLVSELLKDQTKPAIHESIRLLFKHATSKISFRIVIADDIKADVATFSVSSIGLTNIYTQGKLTPSYSGSETLLTWEKDTDSPTKNYTCAADKSYLLLPQTLSNDAQLTLDYSITFKSGGTVFTYEGGKLVESATYTYSYPTASVQLNTLKVTGPETPLTTWEANHHYIYTICLTAKRIEFTGQVVEWGQTIPWEDIVVDQIGGS